jgi:hypothetical protein
VTIKQRVQIGLNIAGGFGVGRGGVDTVSLHKTYQCSFPAGTFLGLNVDASNPCGTNGTFLPGTTTQTGKVLRPFTDTLNYASNCVPIGKVEIAASGTVAPRIKVRISGGFNFPGTHSISVTGLFAFGDN